MRNLFTTWYQCGNEARQAELDHCLKTNVESGLFDNVFVLHSNSGNCTDGWKCSVININYEGKPTYKSFIKCINDLTENSDINIIANTDIIFDETILLADNMQLDECYALSRWELNPDLTKHPTHIQIYGDSQDSWVFKGKIKPLEFCDFPIGTRGCDNRIAYEIQKAGYKITNPSKSIKCWHLHNSNVRDYEPGKGYAVPEPYLNVPVCML